MDVRKKVEEGKRTGRGGEREVEFGGEKETDSFEGAMREVIKKRKSGEGEGGKRGRGEGGKGGRGKGKGEGNENPFKAAVMIGVMP